MFEWISVKDKLPTDPRFVLVYVRHPATSSFPAWSSIMTDMYLGDGWAENADEDAHEQCINRKANKGLEQEGEGC